MRLSKNPHKRFSVWIVESWVWRVWETNVCEGVMYIISLSYCFLHRHKVFWWCSLIWIALNSKTRTEMSLDCIFMYSKWETYIAQSSNRKWITWFKKRTASVFGWISFNKDVREYDDPPAGCTSSSSSNAKIHCMPALYPQHAILQHLTQCSDCWWYSHNLFRIYDASRFSTWIPHAEEKILIFSYQLNWRCFWFVVPWQGIWHLPYRELFERSVCGCTAGANVQPSMAHSSTGCHSPPPINDGELLNRFMKSLLKKTCFYIQPSQNPERAVRDLFFCFSARVFDLAITVTPCTYTHADESFGILKILEWKKFVCKILHNMKWFERQSPFSINRRHSLNMIRVG